MAADESSFTLLASIGNATEETQDPGRFCIVVYSKVSRAEDRNVHRYLHPLLLGADEVSL